MISFDEALELTVEAGRPRGQERLALGPAAGRVLARPAIARVASPRSDVSAMDGYAVCEADLAGFPVRLEITGQSFAGRGWDAPLAPGSCVRVFTGARMPRGADRVVIQENVRREGSFAVIAEPPQPASYVREGGSDFAIGDELLPAGRLMDPRAMVAAAAGDVSELSVYQRPRVRIVSTGDELAAPGQAAQVHDAIPDSVSFGVAALAEQWGAVVFGRQRLVDDPGLMEAAAPEVAAYADLVVVTGGASVGEKDHAKAMFGPLGLELIYSKVAMKPGKPVWLGRVSDALILGLPGNPTSAMVTARLLLAPLLCALSGRAPRDALRWKDAVLSSILPECGDRETFHRARTMANTVELLRNQDSGVQMGLAAADVLIRQRAGALAVPRGELVEVLDF